MNGEFTPVKEIEEIKTSFQDLKRININRYTEGNDKKMIDLFLISPNPSKDSINYTIKKNVLLEFLIKKKLLQKDEISEIYDYVVCDGELILNP
jgi:hypothetical protein